MSEKEIKRLEVMHRLEEKRVTQKKAAEMLHTQHLVAIVVGFGVRAPVEQRKDQNAPPPRSSPPSSASPHPAAGRSGGRVLFYQFFVLCSLDFVLKNILFQRTAFSNCSSQLFILLASILALTAIFSCSSGRTRMMNLPENGFSGFSPHERQYSR